MLDRVHRRLALCLSLAMVPTAFSLAAAAAELKVIAPNAVKEAVSEIASRFEQETKHKLVLNWAGSEAISKRIAEGEVFDVVINTSVGVDGLAKQGKVSAGSKHDFAKSGVAAAVKAGVPRPDVSTVEGLRQTILKAQSVVISSGASGRYLEQLFQKLGIADQIKDKIVQPPSGAQIGDLLARGEAELGFQQVTELVHAKGFQYLGPLPSEVQNYTIWAAAVHEASKEHGVANAFVTAISAPKSVPAIRASGMEPIP